MGSAPPSFPGAARPSPMLTLYNAILAPLRIAAELGSFWAGRNPERGKEWRERLARTLPDVAPGGIWLHGASVGEARILTRIADALGESGVNGPVCASAMTRTGRAQLPTPPAVDAAFFVPLDFRSATGRVLDAVRPALLALVETELWPNLIDGARRRRIPVLLLNGRLAPDRMARYSKLSGLYGPLLRSVAAIGAQSEADAERFISLGVPPEKIEITGNVKYDLPAPQVDSRALREGLGIPADRPIFVAGSTAEGEDPAVLAAFESARSVCPELVLILAPRHPERSDDVERIALARGLRVKRLSATEATLDEMDLLLVDSIGHLSDLYSIATVAFVGGSLVPVGGHNVLEPASAGVPVLFGPHTDHVAEPAMALEERGGGRRVADADALGKTLAELLTSGSDCRQMGKKARDTVMTNQGAVGRTVALVRSVLDRTQPSRGVA